MLLALIKPVLAILQIFSEGSLFGHECEWVDLLTNDPVSRVIMGADIVTPYSVVTDAHAANHRTKCLAIIMQEDEVKANGVPEGLNALSALVLVTGEPKNKETNQVVNFNIYHEVGRGRSLFPDMRSNRTVFYLEETDYGNTYVHVFCPKINGPGKWAKHLAIWSQREGTFFPKVNEKQVKRACVHPLVTGKLKVAWAYRFLMAIMENGKITGVEVKLIESLQSKYNFNAEFILAGHGNNFLSDNDKLVRI